MLRKLKDPLVLFFGLAAAVAVFLWWRSRNATPATSASPTAGQSIDSGISDSLTSDFAGGTDATSLQSLLGSFGGGASSGATGGSTSGTSSGTTSNSTPTSAPAATTTSTPTYPPPVVVSRTGTGTQEY